MSLRFNFYVIGNLFIALKGMHNVTLRSDSSDAIPKKGKSLSGTRSLQYNKIVELYGSRRGKFYLNEVRCGATSTPTLHSSTNNTSHRRKLFYFYIK